MLARFYIEDSEFSGVDVLKDKSPAARERILSQIELVTDAAGFIILVGVLVTLVVVNI